MLQSQFQSSKPYQFSIPDHQIRFLPSCFEPRRKWLVEIKAAEYSTVEWTPEFKKKKHENAESALCRAQRYAKAKPLHEPQPQESS